jgi:ATP-dependent DNA helicase RecQ
MAGPGATFRPGQWEAIEAVTVTRRRVLIVQRTGWGKSAVYFLATRLLRDAGGGPTLIVSPLLSLMRNQLPQAGRIGLRAATLHSANRAEWDAVEADLAAGRADLLLVSPERLGNERFVRTILPTFGGRVGLFVVDEAHCISDWGHDFRPDYRRIRRILSHLPPSVPVLATTATANDRVVADVRDQLGADVLVSRGPLARPSLRLQVLDLPDPAHRLAWLAENLPKFPHGGIVYCQTVADTERVAAWLRSRGLAARAYHAGDDAALDREALEADLLANRVRVLVATVALGMGFDKPDLSFVVHYQRPGSVVAYYQQVGRAGRALDKAYGILLCGAEDADIQNYFIATAFPPPAAVAQIIAALERSDGMSLDDLLTAVNVARSVAEKALKLLELDGAVGADRGGSAVRYFRTPNPWQPDLDHIEAVTSRRRIEMEQMNDYARHGGCLMEFLARALDDPDARPCGVCANCQGRGFSGQVTPAAVGVAVEYLRGEELVLEPRRRWPAGLFPDQPRTIPAGLRCETGRILSYYGDSGWGTFVRAGKYEHGRFADELVAAAARLVGRWRMNPPVEWVTAVPSRRHPGLVADFTARLAHRLGLPFVPVLECPSDRPEQKSMANSAIQARNAVAGLALAPPVPPGSALLVDDIVDSGWTLTMAGRLLRKHGCRAVYPLALARTTVRDAGP